MTHFFNQDEWDSWDDETDFDPFDEPFGMEPESWFDTPRTAPVFENPPVCLSCEFYVATDDTAELCQFCTPKLDRACSEVLDSLGTLLSNHLAFERWCDENLPSVAHAA